MNEISRLQLIICAPMSVLAWHLAPFVITATFFVSIFSIFFSYLTLRKISNVRTEGNSSNFTLNSDNNIFRARACALFCKRKFYSDRQTTVTPSSHFLYVPTYTVGKVLTWSNRWSWIPETKVKNMRVKKIKIRDG